MNYGLYLSASGVLTSLYRQDVFANNLANVNTVGFKADLPTIRQRDPEAVEDNLSLDVRKRMLDLLGGGVLAGPQGIALSQGALTQTGSPLDLALADEKQFFAIQSTDPDTGRSVTRLTRDGRFTRSSDGTLVTAAGGHRVMSAVGGPITLDPSAPVRIDEAGQVVQNGEPVGRVRVLRVHDASELVKAGGNLLRPIDERRPPTDAERPMVRQGYLEASGVDPIRALNSINSATRAVSGNGNLIRYFDQMMDRAINTLGRIA